jgi:cysteinyl-tRNA synthetase
MKPENLRLRNLALPTEISQMNKKDVWSMVIYLLLIAMLATSCGQQNGHFPTRATEPGPTTGRNYRQDMRDFVQAISTYAKRIKPKFIIVPQNGHDLLTENGEETGTPAVAYINAIDGVGREDLFYGYDDDDAATPVSERDRMVSFLVVAEDNGVEVLVTDYCSTESYVDDSYSQNAARGYISFAADHRELDNIPAHPLTPFNMNSANVISLTAARNFLYLLNPGSYSDKADFLKAIRNTNYDAVIIDAFYEDDILTAEDVASLKAKINGGNRLIIAYMSIGEAEDYRYYWQSKWGGRPPSWLAEENPDWPGNWQVRYWEPAWQQIIYGKDNSYLQKILDAGFDGVYLDIIDAFEYFENQ